MVENTHRGGVCFALSAVVVKIKVWSVSKFESVVKAGSFALGVAFEKYPLIVKLHSADLEAKTPNGRNFKSVTGVSFCNVLKYAMVSKFYVMCVVLCFCC